jgi:DNA-directed RNA polymerase subunit RPC12/RpoP
MDGRILGEATYKCSKCGAKHFVHADDFEFEAQSSDERQMGAEIQHFAEIHALCHNCKEEIELEFEVWEYPAGTINHTNESTVGAEVIDSHFSIESLPDPDDGVAEVAKLVKPLLQFRFDKFSEQFVDYWISQYRKNARTTMISSVISLVLASAAVGIGIYTSQERLGQQPPRAQEFKEQYVLLRTTQQNLNDLEHFISSKKNEMEATQSLLGDLEAQRAAIEPIVQANQELVNAMFAQQRRDSAKFVLRERLIGVALGVLASLIASVIWHFVGRFRRKRV